MTPEEARVLEPMMTSCLSRTIDFVKFAASYSGFGLIQLVWTLASWIAFRMYPFTRSANSPKPPGRSASLGHAPTSVWYSR